MPAKKEATVAPAPQEHATATQQTQQQGSNTYAVLALVFGLVSLTGFGLILGIPAIILASISLKRGLPEKGLSITGLVTGIVSTIISLLFLVLIIFAFVWGYNHPEEMRDRDMRREPATEQLFESSRT